MLKRHIYLVLRLAILAGFLAIIVSSWQSYTLNGFVGIRNILNGFIDGSLIVGLVSTYKLIFVDVIFSRFFARLSFARTLLLNSLVYSLLILFGRAFGRYFMEYDRFVLLPIDDAIARKHFLESSIVAVAFSLVFNFLLQNSRLLGPKVLANFFTGRYHRPRPETRIVLFMDLKSSTTIAEKLGDEIYLNFMSEAFADLTEAIISTRAEIYKYVGDEIILSWSLNHGLANSNCLYFPLLMRRLFTERAPYYQERFGHIPEFRSGIHMGELVIGEMGVLKREIAMIGDTMNTAARIAAYCRECGSDVLLSDAVRSAIPLQSGIQITPIGPVALKGKSEPMALFSASLI